MKKLTLMSLIAAMSLSCFIGCSSTDTVKENADTQETVDEVTTESTKENIEEFEPIVTDLTGKVLVDNENFKITANSMGQYDISKDGMVYGTRFDVTVENKSQEDRIYIEKVFVNSLEIDAYWRLEEVNSNRLEVAPGETKDAVLELGDYDFVKSGEEFTDIILAFKYGSVSSSSPIYFSEHIYPLGEENAVKYEHKLSETDTLVAENENVRMIMTDSFLDTEDQYLKIELLVENKTDGNVYFTTSDASFNGNKHVLYHDEEVIPAGLTVKEYIYLDSSELEYYKDMTGIDVSFDEVTDFSFTAWVMDVDSFTDDTYDNMEYEWRNAQEPNFDIFNPGDYALAKGGIATEVQGEELLVRVGESEKVDVSTSDNISSSEVTEMSAEMIQIDGVTYCFPMAAQELVNSGWIMEDGFPFPARPGSNALVGFSKGDLELETNVTSVTGTEVPMEGGSISYLIFSGEYNKDIPVVFPGNITFGMSKEEAEKVLPNGFTYDADKDSHVYEKQENNGKLIIQIKYSANEVTEISYSFWS